MALATNGTLLWIRNSGRASTDCGGDGRLRRLMADTELDSLLCFDMNNVRCLTSPHTGMASLNKSG